MRRAALAFLVCGLLCVASHAQQPPQPPVGNARTLDAWLECVECNEGELQAVVKLGPSVVADLGRSLVSGPSDAKSDSYKRYLRKMYADLKANEKSHPERVVPYSEQEFVNREMVKYANMYRVRAARALGEIGGPEAAKLLDQALAMDLDSYVAAKVKQARAKINTK